jgi:hypothetical protein
MRLIRGQYPLIMKKTLLSVLLLLFLSLTASAQSESFMALKSKFKGSDNVFCFRAGGGLLARAALLASGEDEINDAIKRIHDIQLMVVSKDAFREKRVTVAGYRRLLVKDNYSELLRARDKGDDVTIYIRPDSHGNNLYLILVEEPHEVVAIHFEGHLDPKAILNATDVL